MQQSFFTHLAITIFYWKSKYLKVLNGDVNGTSTGPSCGASRGPKLNIKLVTQGYSRLYSEL